MWTLQASVNDNTAQFSSLKTLKTVPTIRALEGILLRYVRHCKRHIPYWLCRRIRAESFYHQIKDISQHHFYPGWDKSSTMIWTMLFWSKHIPKYEANVAKHKTPAKSSVSTHLFKDNTNQECSNSFPELSLMWLHKVPIIPSKDGNIIVGHPCPTAYPHLISCYSSRFDSWGTPRKYLRPKTCKTTGLSCSCN